MDFSTQIKNSVMRSERFRTPLSVEKKIGLWVDRIGESEDVPVPFKRPRLLGLYGVVAVESGSGSFYSRSTGELKLGTGDAVILFPDEPHLYEPEIRWKTRWIVWSGPESVLLEDLGFIVRSNACVRNCAAIAILAYERLMALMDKEDMASILKRKNIILEMMHDLFLASRAEYSCGQAADRIKRVMEQMQDFENSTLSVAGFAASCGLSETHFRRMFKSHTGRSPKDFMLSVRISKAKEMLAGGYSIKYTAGYLGYRDVFYFMRQFKETTGQTPGNFS